MTHGKNCAIRAECVAAIAAIDSENLFGRGSDLDNKIKVFFKKIMKLRFVIIFRDGCLITAS